MNHEDKIRKEGMKRQCNTQIVDNDIASLSVKSCIFINSLRRCSLNKKSLVYNFLEAYKSEAKFLITLYLISTLVASMISIIAPLKAATFPSFKSI